MAIIRGRLTGDGFTMVPNRWLRDPKLSFKAKGVLAYIASHRADYELTVEQMMRESTDGRDAVRAAMRELETRGYLQRVQRRGPGGRLGATDYRIVEDPDDVCAGDTGDGFSVAGQTVAGSAVAGKSATKKTKGLEDHKENPPNPPAGGGELDPSSQTPQQHGPAADATGPAAARCEHGRRSCRPCGTSPRQQAARDAAEANAKPPWCGTCDERTRQRMTDDDRPYRCPTCHPAGAGAGKVPRSRTGDTPVRPAGVS